LLCRGSDQLGEIAALHVLHHDVEGVSLLLEIENLNDVGMIELRCEIRFFAEHGEELRVLDEVRQDALDHDLSGEARGAQGVAVIDFGHPTASDAIPQSVLTEEVP